jgi:acetylglutamate kinase
MIMSLYLIDAVLFKNGQRVTDKNSYEIVSSSREQATSELKARAAQKNLTVLICGWAVAK